VVYDGVRGGGETKVKIGKITRTKQSRKRDEGGVFKKGLEETDVKRVCYGTQALGDGRKGGPNRQGRDAYSVAYASGESENMAGATVDVRQLAIRNEVR